MSAERIRRALLSALCALLLATATEAQGGRRHPRQPGAHAGKHAPKTADKQPPLYLPGFGSSDKKADERPLGPQPKPGGAKPPPAAPPDPMKEADLVTRAADRRAEFELEQQELLAQHFRLCDLDDNGWISLRESGITLAFSRDEFLRADANQDGRLDRSEFTLQKDLVLARLGLRSRVDPEAPAAGAAPAAESAGGPVEPVPPPPAPAAKSPLRSLFPRPADLIARYDADHSRGLDAHEIEKLFTEIGLELSPELVVAQMDPDDSGQLGPRELVPIAWLAAQHMPESLRPPSAEPAPTPAETAPPADTVAAASPQPDPPRAATHFARLDANHDGFVDEADLRTVQGPARLDVRLRAVLSAMDEDGDGRLSEDEFRRSMVPGKP